ncbi:Cullin-associated NEDD8-dissociated protein 1 [Oryzias melastigma]|uniref:Cullin-associated NEDD8-dissociated protein 1 n=1 Tax=Oryzias melastigma TaxID=30732 RepID=A0A834L1F7_ORYME|nr:Cullin-associated NEDD8-dissociated protein 1 [Oryzias melastigma]
MDQDHLQLEDGLITEEDSGGRCSAFPPVIPEDHEAPSGSSKFKIKAIRVKPGIPTPAGIELQILERSGHLPSPRSCGGVEEGELGKMQRRGRMPAPSKARPLQGPPPPRPAPSKARPLSSQPNRNPLPLTFILFVIAVSEEDVPAPLQRKRELHSNTANCAARDATVAVEETGGRSSRRSNRTHLYLQKSRTTRSGHAGLHVFIAQSASRRLTANSTAMASASYHISNLLEKMTSSDKDFRFMATNDLMTELQKDSIKLDDDSERKVVRMILKLLEDKNGEVQNLAVKCLGPLVSKVKEYQVETIVDTLCTNMLSDKEQLRDISSIGLKTVIGELPPASSGSALAASVCKKITGRLTSAIAKQEDVSVQLEALDIMADMLCRQGGLLVNFHPSILSCLLPQLTSPRLAVRKRTIMALGHLVMSCGNLVFIDLIEHLLTELGRNDNMSTTRTYIQCTAAISRQAGHRIGEYLEKIIPLVVKFCNVDDDELREYCIQAFESFVRRCPKEVYPHVPTIISICLRYLTYDPNYNFDDEDEDDNAMDAEQNDEDYQGSDDEYSDDDDMSWKVRRAAAKCLDAVVSTRHEMLPEFYRSVSPALVSRFKEREENCEGRRLPRVPVAAQTDETSAELAD